MSSEVDISNQSGWWSPGHRVPSVARDGSGHLHVFAGMHNEEWIYFRTDGTTSGALVNCAAEMPPEDLSLHTKFTYPILATAPNGDVYMISRAGKTSKRHIVVDGNELPLGLHVEAGNVHDLKAAIPALESIAVPGREGRATEQARRACRRQGLRQPLLSRLSAGPRHPALNCPKTDWHSPLQKPIGIWRSNRWKVECFFAWLNGFRRLGIRFERHSFIYTGFLTLASILICLRSPLQ